jgi:anthranilate synthase
MPISNHIQYRCASGVQARRLTSQLDYATAIDQLADSLDESPGVLLASSFEFPDRYTRWDIGFVNPPLKIAGKDRNLEIAALNVRGEILLPEIHRALQNCAAIASMDVKQKSILVNVSDEPEEFAEEMRSRKSSLFSVLREIVSCFSSPSDPYLGLFGAFGYDLRFQFEDVIRHQSRSDQGRDLVLYLPDQITVSDHRIEKTFCHSYEFVCRGWDSDEFSETTGVFRRGDLFEVVPGQVFFEPCNDSPAAVFKRLKQSNPSPEMFVRVDGSQIETCPISGTIKRGTDAIDDANQIKTLLNSDKVESELSMCTDVDRNDKSRVCEPGSVRVLGRRQIEMYSRLIHTVDHVKGILKPEFDALDGFLAHTWAVTVTGAPKLAAMQFIEQNEKSQRHWYGGAIGHIGFDGNLNTGLTLRTIRIKNGIAEVRAGATLLIDSDPVEEELETRLKASALIDSIRGTAKKALSGADRVFSSEEGVGITALMVDHQDSFVHNLGTYFRQCGVEVLTLRPEAARKYLENNSVDLVILSPGPSAPKYFCMNETIDATLARAIPIFGVCLGLQGLVEYFGGELQELAYPMHGKQSDVSHDESEIFAGIASPFAAGRYHSLVAKTVPECLTVTAKTEDGSIMAIQHASLPMQALQFHPESIMSLRNAAGHTLIRNVVKLVAA